MISFIVNVMIKIKQTGNTVNNAFSIHIGDEGNEDEDTTFTKENLIELALRWNLDLYAITIVFIDGGRLRRDPGQESEALWHYLSASDQSITLPSENISLLQGDESRFYTIAENIDFGAKGVFDSFEKAVEAATNIVEADPNHATQVVFSYPKNKHVKYGAGILIVSWSSTTEIVEKTYMPGKLPKLNLAKKYHGI